MKPIKKDLDDKKNQASYKTFVQKGVSEDFAKKGREMEKEIAKETDPVKDTTKEHCVEKIMKFNKKQKK